MSEFREDLLVTPINKKRVIKIIITAVLLVGAFAFSSFFFSFLWDSQRPPPSDRLSEAEDEDVVLMMPPFPYNLSDFQNQLPDLTPDQLQELLDMFDGDIDDLDLSNFSQTIIPLLGSEVEVFRVYDYDDYDDLNEMSKNLWRYECFDEFSGDGWHSTANSLIFDLYSFSNHSTYYWDSNLIRLKIPLAPTIGINSMVIPALFPTPFIMEDLYANNLASTTLYKDSFNCTTLDLDFILDDPVNLSYNLFGLDLPSDNEVNNSALDEDITPSLIKNKFLQFPSSKNVYLNSNPFFKSHYDILNTIIKVQDNTFEVANKIRNYLQENFTIGIDALQNDPPTDTEDVVEWFCEHREGLWTEFASAFTMFCRAFNVSSRFIDGFNSRGIVEDWDMEEMSPYFSVKYKNIYNWAEIYVPTDISGSGMWVQMDITPLIDFNLDVYSNSSVFNRPSYANITAVLSSSNASVGSRRINFFDETMQRDLGSVLTDINGEASIVVDINNSQVVGPHIIFASYLSVFDYTNYTVLGNVEVNLTIINPPIVNISDSLPNNVNVQGYIYDPINNQRIQNAEVNYLLFREGTFIRLFNPFSPRSSFTDNNGVFNTVLNLNPSVLRGNYEIRVDFNGTWDLYGFPFTMSIINDSSNRMDFDVTDEKQFDLYFYINDIEAWDFESPSVSRDSTLELKARVLNETGDPVQGEIVDFYDHSQNLYIGSNTTDVNGVTTYNYFIDNIAAGPNKLYVQLGNLRNYSYFILDAPISLNLDIWPLNREISKRGTFNRTFIIHGFINDTENSLPVRFGELSLHLFDGPLDVSHYLIQQAGSLRSNLNGEFFAVFRVDDLTPTRNYTLQLQSNGEFSYIPPTPAPYYFNLWSYVNFSRISNANFQLEVYDPAEIDDTFRIEGQHTLIQYNNSYPPATYNRGDLASFEVQINQSKDYAPDGSIVTLRDIYTDTNLGSHTFNYIIDQGYYLFVINTSSFHAGLHRIEVEFESSSIIYNVNSTYIVINETINIDVVQNNLRIVRNSDNFIITGTVHESGINLRALVVRIFLLESSEYGDNSSYLHLSTPYSILINDDGTFQYTVNYIDLNCPQGQYNITIYFGGSIYAPGIALSNYMETTISPLRDIDVIAGTQFIQDTYYTQYESLYPDIWADHDVLYVIGNLTWDNGTALSGMIVNVTVKRLDGSIVSYNDTVVTDQYGGFTVSLYIDPVENWPTNRVDSEIWVYFDQIVNGINYVEQSEEQYL